MTLPRVATALRAAIATVVPFYLAFALRRPELIWVALGGWLGAIADPGGARLTRARAIGTFAVLGGVVTTLGLYASPHVIAAAVLIATVAFVASLARALGPVATSVGTLVTITVAVAACARGDAPLRDGAMFTLGASWATLLSSIVWPVRAHAGVRDAVATVYAKLGAYATAIAEGARATSPDASTAVMREHQRAVRAAIDAARAAVLAVRSTREGESVVGGNLRVLLGDAEAQFFDLIALAEHADATRSAPPLLDELPARYAKVCHALVEAA